MPYLGLTTMFGLQTSVLNTCFRAILQTKASVWIGNQLLARKPDLASLVRTTYLPMPRLYNTNLLGSSTVSGSPSPYRCRILRGLCPPPVVLWSSSLAFLCDVCRVLRSKTLSWRLPLRDIGSSVPAASFGFAWSCPLPSSVRHINIYCRRDPAKVLRKNLA